MIDIQEYVDNSAVSQLGHFLRDDLLEFSVKQSTLKRQLLLRANTEW